ncbi:MAG: D-proline reductase (dithiol) PrdB [Flavobacterium sp.]|jgi:D-proline reductase (dithiol) PrdB
MVFSSTSASVKPVSYMQRTRSYYKAQGFDKYYTWAKGENDFQHKLSKPLNDCRVTFVTTAVPDGRIPKMARTASSQSISTMPDRFRTDELSWDKEATHTDDRGSYVPLLPLLKLQDEGVIASIANRYHFVPTEYSQSKTIDHDAPAILKACLEDEVDIAILIPL